MKRWRRRSVPPDFPPDYRGYVGTVGGAIILYTDRDPYLRAAPKGSRALTICCPECQAVTGLTLSWDRPDRSRRSRKAIPVRMWCPSGHRWDDVLPPGMLRAVLAAAAEPQGPPPETTS